MESSELVEMEELAYNSRRAIGWKGKFGIGLLAKKIGSSRVTLTLRPAFIGMTTAFGCRVCRLGCSMFPSSGRPVACFQPREIGTNPTRRDVHYVGKVRWICWIGNVGLDTLDEESWQIRGSPLGSTGCRIHVRRPHVYAARGTRLS